MKKVVVRKGVITIAEVSVEQQTKGDYKNPYMKDRQPKNIVGGEQRSAGRQPGVQANQRPSNNGETKMGVPQDTTTAGTNAYLDKLAKLQSKGKKGGAPKDGVKADQGHGKDSPKTAVSPQQGLGKDSPKGPGQNAQQGLGKNAKDKTPGVNAGQGHGKDSPRTKGVSAQQGLGKDSPKTSGVSAQQGLGGKSDAKIKNGLKATAAPKMPTSIKVKSKEKAIPGMFVKKGDNKKVAPQENAAVKSVKAKTKPSMSAAKPKVKASVETAAGKIPKTKTAPWAAAMLNIVKTVDKKADGGLTGMGSQDGYYSDKPLKDFEKAFKLAGYKRVKSGDNVSFEAKGSDSYGVVFSPTEDGLCLNFFMD